LRWSARRERCRWQVRSRAGSLVHECVTYSGCRACFNGFPSVLVVACDTPLISEAALFAGDVTGRDTMTMITRVVGVNGTDFGLAT